MVHLYTASPAPSEALAHLHVRENGSATESETVPVGLIAVPVSQLLGPILVGVLLNCFVYGISFLQWLQYTLGRNRDRWFLK